MAQAEYEEDRDDQFEDDDDGANDEAAVDSNRPKNFAEDSLAFSMSMPKGIGI